LIWLISRQSASQITFQLLWLEASTSAFLREKAIIIGIPDALRIALTNLIDDAVRYTPEGGSVDVSVRSQGTQFTFEVADTGCGVDEKDLPRLFDRFFRAAPPNIEGNGLGLAIVEIVAKHHDLKVSVHVILTNRCYATGKWPYGVRNSRTGLRHDPASIVEIDVPTIIPMDLLDSVRGRLAANNPRITAPRIVNGATLLTGLAVCASCGAGMTRTGTQRRHRSYSYYSCAGCHQKGKSVCRGRHIPMVKLDNLVIANIKERLFTPDRLAIILEGLLERRESKDKAVQDRRSALQGVLEAKRDKLTRLYRAIEDGIVELDAELKDRIAALKTERDIAQASFDRIAGQIGIGASIRAERLEAFANFVREKIGIGRRPGTEIIFARGRVLH